MAELRQKLQELRCDVASVEAERDKTERRFDSAVDQVRSTADMRNVVLEHRVTHALASSEEIEAQLTQLASVAGITSEGLEHVSQSVRVALGARNELRRNLVTRLQTARKVLAAVHRSLCFLTGAGSQGLDDCMNTYREKLLGLGVPQDELQIIGLAAGCGTLRSMTTGPAGLIVA
jgi:hypothetical protein